MKQQTQYFDNGIQAELYLMGDILLIIQFLNPLKNFILGSFLHDLDSLGQSARQWT